MSAKSGYLWHENSQMENVALPLFYVEVHGQKKTKIELTSGVNGNNSIFL